MRLVARSRPCDSVFGRCINHELIARSEKCGIFYIEAAENQSLAPQQPMTWKTGQSGKGPAFSQTPGQEPTVAPERRTIVVLAALVMGMTLTSGLLLLLEPGPVAPLTGLTLTSLDRSASPEQKLFDTSTTPRQWQAIVIHDSGSLTGSSRTLHQAHEQAGRDGLGYHFVVNNGTGEEDGVIEMGFRWPRQLAGQYVEGGEDAQWFNENAIGICVVGDVDRESPTVAQRAELLWLVQQLQARFNIPRDRVYVEVGSSADSATHLFPHAWFRSQLLTARAH